MIRHPPRVERPRQQTQRRLSRNTTNTKRPTKTWPNTAVQVRMTAKARAAVKQATVDVWARTAAKARAVAPPMARRCPAKEVLLRHPLRILAGDDSEGASITHGTF